MEKKWRKNGEKMAIKWRQNGNKNGGKKDENMVIKWQ